MAHKIYDNFYLSNEIEDQFNSHLDLQQFCTVDNSLVGTAGMTRKINRYSASNATQKLAMGAGNTKSIEVTYAPFEYKILMAQNRFEYYDEQEMTDPMLVPVGVRHMGTDMFNTVNADIFAEFNKATQVIVVSALNFDAFADAQAMYNLENIEGVNFFAFVSALLGSVGTPLIVNIALGTAILAELGIATGLFLVEIWAIGKGLDEIGQAWQPVLDNGETIATAIGLGTALLVGIGVVTAALGAATVASAGLLPLAIGLGTALLVELAAAFIIFTESLIAVANELGDNLAPALDRLNDKLPTLSTNMSEFVDFMTDFAGEVVRYTEVSAIAGLSATIDTIIGWFTQDPVEKLADDVENIYNQTTTLNEKLNLAVPELKTAIDLLKQYKGFLTEMETLCNSNVELSTGMFVNMKEVGQKLVTGFVDGIKSKSSDFSNAAKTLVDGFKNSLNTNAATCKSSFISWASNLKNWFTSASFGAINRTTFGNYAKDIVSGFNNGITNNYATAKSGMVSFANTVKNAFTEIVSYKVFYDIAKDVISGFNNGINDFYDTTRPYMRRWANDAAAAYKAALDSNSPSKRFMRIGEDTVLGYNLGIANLGGTTKGVVTDWANSFTSVNPTMSFAVDTSALKYYSSDSFAQSVSADVAAHSTVTATGFKEGMEEFYREYIEPTLSQMADDMRRQADKQEQTVVQIGNRVVNDAVTTQKKANGYVFAR